MKSNHFYGEYQAAGLTDIGKKRKENEDRIILVPEEGFFAVSDGMGGLRCGAEASTYVSRSMPELIDLWSKECGEDTTPEEASESLKQIVQMLSDALYRKGNSPYRFDYGATLVGIWLYRDQAIYVDLGDSRGYYLPAGSDELVQITQDMNIAGILVRNGQMTKEEAAASRASSRLTAFVGMEEPATPEVFLQAVHPGDRLLLCSDGLHGVVPEKEIVSMIRAKDDPEQVCRDLIDAANRGGGRDNISAVLIRIDQVDAPEKKKPEITLKEEVITTLREDEPES